MVENNISFKKIVSNFDTYEDWILTLGEQGRNIAWNCSNMSDKELYNWLDKFKEVTDA